MYSLTQGTPFHCMQHSVVLRHLPVVVSLNQMNITGPATPWEPLVPSLQSPLLSHTGLLLLPHTHLLSPFVSFSLHSCLLGSCVHSDPDLHGPPLERSFLALCRSSSPLPLYGTSHHPFSFLHRGLLCSPVYLHLLEQAVQRYSKCSD